MVEASINWIGWWTLTKREIFRFLVVGFQTFFPPIMSAVLYLTIFGYFLGNRISFPGSVSYVEFIMPGIVMMGAILGAYQNTAASLFVARWYRSVDDMLIAPLSYVEMVSAITIGGIVRGLMVGIAIFLLAIPFIGYHLQHPLLGMLFLILVALVFSCFGILVALFSEKFDHLAAMTTFFITPFTYLGGIFYPVAILPGAMKQLTFLNPMFYMINGLRYSILGYADTKLSSSFAVVIILGILLFAICVELFRRGIKLRY